MLPIDSAARSRGTAANSQTARAQNRDIILRTIHRNQPVSRADLARTTGLQPSTVSSITDQLIQEGWVTPGTLGRLPRGRRPTFVALSDRHVALAIDLRPGKANLALVDINGKILTRKTVGYQTGVCLTLEEAEVILAQVAQAAQSLKTDFADRVVHGLGVSVSGRINHKTNRLIFTPNAPWSQIDLYGELQKFFHGPIEMENAATACLFSERWFGEFRDASNLLLVSISEGIGVGLLIDGRIARGHNDMAGEFGHMTLDESGPRCGCGNSGCWEVFASNRAGLRYYREMVPESTISTFQDLLDLAKAGDLPALRSIDKMMACFTRGLTMLVAGLAPEAVIVVGECTALWSRIRPLIESQLIVRSFSSHTPTVVPAVDGDGERLRGAASLVLHKVLFGQADLLPDPAGKSAQPLPQEAPI